MRRQIYLASTTSTEDSGLFEVLIPAFEAAHPEHSVIVLAVGSRWGVEAMSTSSSYTRPPPKKSSSPRGTGPTDEP